jgi:hypothetical protein
VSDIIERAKQVGFHRAALEAGATISDGAVTTDFTAAWGLAGLKRHKVAHYWASDRPQWMREVSPDMLYALTSACGLRSIGTKQVPLFAAGNYPYCARCEAKMMKAIE